MTGYAVGTVVMNNSKSGRYKGMTGRIVKINPKTYTVFLFSDKKEHNFPQDKVVEVLPEEASDRAPGRKSRHVDEKTCDSDKLVMAFHKGLPNSPHVTESEFDELVGLLKEFFLD